MRTIGLDLAVQTAHKAVVLDERGHFCTPILTVHTQPSELDHLLARARDGVPSAEVQLVMEPTGMAWFPVAVYYARQALPIANSGRPTRWRGRMEAHGWNRCSPWPSKCSPSMALMASSWISSNCRRRCSVTKPG